MSHSLSVAPFSVSPEQVTSDFPGPEMLVDENNQCDFHQKLG